MEKKMVKAMSAMLMPCVREMASAIGVVAILFFSAHSVYAQVPTPPQWQGAANQAFYNTLWNGGTPTQARQAYYGSLQGTQNQAVAATNNAIDAFNTDLLTASANLASSAAGGDLLGLTLALPSIANTTASGLNLLSTTQTIQNNWTSRPIPPPPTPLEQGPASNTPVPGNASLFSAVGTGSSTPSSVSPSPISGNNTYSQYQQNQPATAGQQALVQNSGISSSATSPQPVSASAFQPPPQLAGKLNMAGEPPPQPLTPATNLSPSQSLQQAMPPRPPLPVLTSGQAAQQYQALPTPANMPTSAQQQSQFTPSPTQPSTAPRTTTRTPARASGGAGGN